MKWSSESPPVLPYQMLGEPTVPPPPPAGKGSVFGDWSNPATVEVGVTAHQLYSQITWRFYDIFLGIVRTRALPLAVDHTAPLEARELTRRMCVATTGDGV